MVYHLHQGDDSDMPDWKDEIAKTVANQVADDNRNKEAFNNEQSLINGQSANIWRVISDSLTAARGIINQAAGSAVLDLKFPPKQSGGEIKATYNRSSRVRKGNIVWSTDQRQIVTAVIGEHGNPTTAYALAVQNSQVVLKSNTDTVDGEGLAEAFLRTLTAP
jgi:hypothetical protein